MASQGERALRFKALHERERAFVIPNPWDAGSARLLESLGFEALATTSSGFANTLGRLDGEVKLAEKVEHCRALCAVTSLPVSADLENGFGSDPREVAGAIVQAAAAGVVGASLEDWGGAESPVIYEIAQAVERVEAAVEVARSLPFPFTLTARAENLLHGHNDLRGTIRRLQAFEAAGADVLYAPGLRTLEEVRAVVGEVGKPINVLAPLIPGVTVVDLEEAGARRISLGGALARASLAPLLQASREMLNQGGFSWAAKAVPGGELAALLTSGDG
ncbi:MAG: isocitrate lyase/phosphoenolpyruvate mutase family protein [Deltaproteobacteria bacterium]|nr:isocitrate lyase/phosphoenolpyruvate mutase family protein [Deltaproteobacteria bacterium]